VKGGTMQILYFGRLREMFGRGEEFMPPPADATVAGLLAVLRERGGVWAAELAEDRAFRVAVDQEVVGADAPIKADSEVAVFPPVTGG
jgi:molybdopterin synthase sulfur carrier subunit